MAVLREFHERRNAEPISLLLQRLYERTKVLELFLLRPSGEQRAANLLKVVDQARAVEATQRVSFRGFVRWLARLRETEARETESPSAEAGDNFVQFLSIHGAKGLEFPIVFVVDMNKGKGRSASFAVLRGRPAADGQFAFYLGAKDAGYQTPNWPGDEYEERREEAEHARLFYVAATRARDYLVLLPAWGRGDGGLAHFLGEDARPKKAEWGVAGPRGFVFPTATLDLAAPPPRAFRLAPPAAGPLPAEAAARLAARAEWRRRLAQTLAQATSGPQVRSPSRLEEGFAAPRDEPEAAAGSDAGRRIGTLVHDCLKRAAVDAPDVLRARLRAEAKGLGLPGDLAGLAARLLDTALGSALLRRARAAAACGHEVPFAVPVGGTILTGAMDLLFVEGDRVVVVDFKTDAVRDEAELARRAQGYEPQALAYALAAEKALCKPVGEVVLFFLAQGREWRIAVTDPLRRQAAQQVSSSS